MKKIVVRILMGIFALIFLLGAGAAVWAGTFVYKNYKELPNIEELVTNYTPSVPTTIFDRNGVLIDSIYREKREPVNLEDISENLKKAVVSIEDKTFYNHYGLNIKRNIASVIANISAGRAVQGASTITQQLAKNAFLTSEKKLSRKVKEALITFEIESIFTKDEILEKYLNEINFGSGSYGIKSAAYSFMRKTPAELNLAESAMLAGMPNRPEKYNPRRNLSEALKRAHLILGEMLKDGVITKAEHQEAIGHKFIVSNEKIDLKKIDKKITTLIYPKEARTESSVPDFTDLVHEFLRNEKNNDGERVFTDEMIYSEGLKVYTTVDIEIQKTAKELFSKSQFLNARPGLQYGMATINSETGEVIAVIGGKDYKIGNFNRAVMAKRQLGSSAKPFLYFTALQNGTEMNAIIDDNKVKYGNWEPKNYGDRYNGNITLLDALDKSLNMVSIKLLEKVGVPALKETIKKFGTEFKIPNNLTASLGTYEGTPLELSQAYAVFANGGYSVKPVIVKTVQNRFGNQIYHSEIKKQKEFDPVDVSLITYMLESSVKSGTSKRAEVKDKNGDKISQGGKTGTTNQNRTVWFAGITPKYTTTIYLGYDDNREIKENLTGGNGPAPIWGEFYKKLLDKGLYTPERFQFVDDNIRRGTLITQNLNSKNGLIATSGGREFLVRSGRISLERDTKYSNGIAGLFYRPEVSVPILGDGISSEKQEGSLEKESNIFKRLFGN
ncbi:MAG: transglycosylase domain-containing protein [Fusobacteriaceae bacterium]